MLGCKEAPSHPVARLTSAFVQHIVKGAVGHPVGDDDGVRSGGRLAGTQHWQHIWVGENPVGKRQVSFDTSKDRPGCCSRGRAETCHHHPSPVHLSLGYSSLKSRLFRVVQSRILRTLMTMSFPCQRPFQSCREVEGSGHLVEPGIGDPSPSVPGEGRAGELGTAPLRTGSR